MQAPQRTLEVSEEQLELARTQAEMRADLYVSFWVERSERKPSIGLLHVEVSNDGDATAHNMRCWIYMQVDTLGPRPLRSTTRDVFLSHIERS